MRSLTRSGGGPTDTFAYNGMGARVKRTDAAWGLRIYTRDGLMPASDVLFDGGMNFTPGISQRSGGGQDLYYNDDALGSVTDMTDLNGNIATTRKWDAFGNKSGTVSTHLRGWNEGSGYEEDSASGLRLLGYRYYDPSIGRFLSPDPIGDGSNWYAYCDNNPVTFSDPLGLMPYNMNDDPADNYGMGSYNSFDLLENILDGCANFYGGWGDGLSYGGVLSFATGKSATQLIRELIGVNDVVNTGSTDYIAGQAVAAVHGAAIGFAAGGAAAGVRGPVKPPPVILEGVYEFECVSGPKVYWANW